MPHIHDKIDFTSEVFVVYNRKVLLRKHDKYKIWLSIGGHIELNEDPNEAAVREVKEEVGLDIQLYSSRDLSFLNTEGYRELIVPQFLNRHRINEHHEHVTSTYFARAFSDELILLDTELTEACKWFSLAELSNENYEIKEHVKYYAKKALEVLSF
jgi:8-oxo-dGTP pyrophosphatase MutT (NUDIX family)